MSSVCQYNQFGHCKFGTRCEKFHTTETCDSFPCVNRECDKRLPKLCQYFAVYGWCRFAGNCSFLHYNTSRCVHNSTSSTNQGLQEVKQAMSELKNEIKTLRLEVDRLERQNQNLLESIRQLNWEKNVMKDTGHEDRHQFVDRIDDQEVLDDEPEPSVEEYCDELGRERYMTEHRCIGILVGIIAILKVDKNGEAAGKVRKSDCLNRIGQLQNHRNAEISTRAQEICSRLFSEEQKEQKASNPVSRRSGRGQQNPRKTK